MYYYYYSTTIMRIPITNIIIVLIASCCCCCCSALIIVDNENPDFEQEFLFPSNSTCDFDGCGTPPPNTVANDRVCQVVGPFVPVDCSCKGNDTVAPFRSGCFECDVEGLTARKNFTTLQQAIDLCPYNPSVIEVVGTHFGNKLIFPKDRDVIMRGYLTRIGITECAVAGDTKVEKFKKENPGVFFDFLLNITVSRVPIVPDKPTTIVGANLEMGALGTSFTSVNITWNGCNTDNPWFRLCGWEHNNTKTGVCDLSIPDPLDDPEDLIVCEKNATHVRNCDSDLGFKLNCTQFIRPEGPCFDEDGSFDDECDAVVTLFWNCTNHEMFSNTTRFKCRFDKFVNGLVRCQRLGPIVFPSAPPRPSPTTGCELCPNKEEEETFVDCEAPPPLNHTRLFACDGCLSNNNLTIINSTLQNYRGQWVIKLYAYEEDVHVRIEDSNFVDLPGTVLDIQGVHTWRVNRNLFERTGGLNREHVFLKANFLGRGTYELINNAHFLNVSTQEPDCFYYFNGETRCKNGNLECLNFPNTTINDCTPTFRPALNGVLFDQDCAVFEKCPCNTQNLTDSFNSTTFNNTIDVPPGFNFDDTEIIADGIITKLLFSLRGLGLSFSLNQLIFLPCAASNLTTPLNFTVPDDAGSNNTLTNSFRCPQPINGTLAFNETQAGNSTFECEERVRCPCPVSPLERKGMFCNFQIQDGLGCQNGFAVCQGNFSVANITFNIENGTFTADAGFNTTFVNGTDAGASNSTTGGLRCLSDELTFCTCPVVNITRNDMGNITDSSNIPADELSENADTMGGNGTHTWELLTSYNFTAGNSSLSCNDGELRCDCTNSTISESNICYDIHDCAVSFHLDNIPENAKVVRIWDNLAEGLEIGLQLERVGYDVIADNSFLVPRWFEETGKMHEIFRQNNNFTGKFHDMADGWTDCDRNEMNAENVEECIADASNVISGAEEQEEIYAECGLTRRIPCKLFFCDDGCPIFVPREIDEACSVDLRFHPGTPEFGTFRFRTIEDAIEDCGHDQPESIVVHASGGVYDSVIVFDRDDIFLFSLNNAIIIRVNHALDTDEMTIRGIHFINDQLEPFPVFRVGKPNTDLWPNYPDHFLNPNDQEPTNVTIKNCLIDGGFAIGTGIILGDFHGVTILYNTIINIIERAIDVSSGEEDYELERITVKWNVFINVEGQCFRGRQLSNYDISCNKFISTRGFADAVLMDIWQIEIRNSIADVDMTFPGFEISDGESEGESILEDLFSNLGEVPFIPSCQPDDEDGTGEDADDEFEFIGNLDIEDGFLQEGCALGKFPECWFVGNIQVVSTKSIDIKDICFHLVRGDMLPIHIRDNVCTKAMFGLYTEHLTYVDFDTRHQVAQLNPLVIVRIHQNENFGSDFLFRRLFSLVDRPCSFPCCRDYEDFPLGELEVNKNFDIYNNHPLFIDLAYGFNKFNNITYAVKNAPFAYQGFLRTNSTLRVTAYNASRLSEERFFFDRTATIRGQLAPCGVFPAIHGCLHVLDTWYLNVSRLELVYDNCDKAGDPLFLTSSGPVNNPADINFSITFNLMFNDTFFNGNNLTNGRVVVMDLRIAEPNGTLDFNRCKFFNWAIFPPGSKRLNQKLYLNGQEPDAPYLRCASLRAQIEDDDGRELLDKRNNGFSRVEVLTEKFKKECQFQDSEADCATAPENTGHERKVPRLERKCPGGNCQDYYMGDQNNRAQGRAVETIRSGKNGRLIRADMAPSVSTIFAQFGSNLVKAFETIMQRSQTDEQADLLEILSDEFGSPTEFEIRRNLVSLGMFEPFVDDDDADELVDHYFDDLTSFRTTQRNFRDINIDDPVTGTALARERVATRAAIVNCTFLDIAGSMVTIVNAHSIKIKGNQALDCGMYDAYASHGFAMIGRRDSTGNYIFTDNFFNQRRSPLFPQTNAGSSATVISNAPVHYAAYRVSSICDANEFEFRNNTSVVNRFINDPDGTISFTTAGRLDGRNITGAMYGLRISGVCTLLFDNTIDQSNNFFPTFRPDQVPLRDLVSKENEDLKGIVCDIVICEPTQDLTSSTVSFKNDCICCVDGCKVLAPVKCFVDRDNDTFVPENPFFGKLLFVDIGTALNKCEAPTRTIVVVPQDSPYTDPIIVQGPGNFLLESPDGATIQTSRITINAPNLVFKDLTFEHEGNQPTIITEIQLSNFTILNSTFDGGDTFQSAIFGTFGNLTIQEVRFFDYDSEFLINMTSNCGHLNFINNTVEGVPGAALYATGLNSYVVTDNLFLDSGSRESGINPMLYLEGCLFTNGTHWFVNSTGPMLFDGNKSFQLDTDGIEDMPDCGYGTTYYFNGLPPSNFEISNNVASGLQVGMRLLNFTDTPISGKTIGTTHLPGWFLQKLIYFNGNARVTGETFDLVAVHQCFDEELLETDPDNLLGLFCNDGCRTKGGNSSVFVFFFLVLFLLFLGCVLSCYISDLPPAKTTFSKILNTEVYVNPSDQAYFNELRGNYRGGAGRDHFYTDGELTLINEEKARRREVLEQNAQEQQEYVEQFEMDSILNAKPDVFPRDDDED